MYKTQKSKKNDKLDNIKIECSVCIKKKIKSKYKQQTGENVWNTYNKG